MYVVANLTLVGRVPLYMYMYVVANLTFHLTNVKSFGVVIGNMLLGSTTVLGVLSVEGMC